VQSKGIAATPQWASSGIKQPLVMTVDPNRYRVDQRPDCDGSATTRFRLAIGQNTCRHGLGSLLGKEPQDFAHHALSLVGREDELRVRGAFQDDQFLRFRRFLIEFANSG